MDPAVSAKLTKLGNFKSTILSQLIMSFMLNRIYTVAFENQVKRITSRFIAVEEILKLLRSTSLYAYQPKTVPTCTNQNI